LRALIICLRQDAKSETLTDAALKTRAVLTLPLRIPSGSIISLCVWARQFQLQTTEKGVNVGRKDRIVHGDFGKRGRGSRLCWLQGLWNNLLVLLH